MWTVRGPSSRRRSLQIPTVSRWVKLIRKLAGMLLLLTGLLLVVVVVISVLVLVLVISLLVVVLWLLLLPLLFWFGDGNHINDVSPPR